GFLPGAVHPFSPEPVPQIPLFPDRPADSDSGHRYFLSLPPESLRLLCRFRLKKERSERLSRRSSTLHPPVQKQWYYHKKFLLQRYSSPHCRTKAALCPALRKCPAGYLRPRFLHICSGFW